MSVWSYISISVLLNGFGQLMLKRGVTGFTGGGMTFPQLPELAREILGSPLVIGGLACYAVSMLIWLKILSLADVSYAYPATVSLTYALVLIGSALFLGEKVSVMRSVGIVVIVGGVFIAAMS